MREKDEVECNTRLVGHWWVIKSNAQTEIVCLYSLHWFYYEVLLRKSIATASKLHVELITDRHYPYTEIIVVYIYIYTRIPCKDPVCIFFNSNFSWNVVVVSSSTCNILTMWTILSVFCLMFFFYLFPSLFFLSLGIENHSHERNKFSPICCLK